MTGSSARCVVSRPVLDLSGGPVPSAGAGRAPAASGHRSLLAHQRRVSLCETLDRVLNKGAVVAGDVIISVADVDLLYVGLNLVVTSVESMREWAAAAREAPARATAGCPPGGRPAAGGPAPGSGHGPAGGGDASVRPGLAAGLGV